MAAANEIVQQEAKCQSVLERIPIEILHKIFSYLLLGKNVRNKLPLRHGGPHYTFQWNLLMLNRNLGTQAKDYLLTNNAFAQVSLAALSFAPRLQIDVNLVPIVTYTSDCQLPVLRIDVGIDEDFVVVAGFIHHDCDFGCKGCEETYRSRSFMILFEDVQALCYTLQLDNHMYALRHTILSSDTKSHWDQAWDEVPFTLDVDYSISKAAKHSAKPAEQLRKEAFEPFRALHGTGYAYHFRWRDTRSENDTDTVWRTDLGLAIALDNPFVSAEAMGWDLVKLIRWAKSQIDSQSRISASKTKSKLGLRGAYRRLLHIALGNQLTSLDLHRPQTASNNEPAPTKTWQLALGLVRLDILMTVLRLEFVFDNYKDAWPVGQLIWETLSYMHLECYVEYDQLHAIALHHAVISEVNQLTLLSLENPTSLQRILQNLEIATRLDPSNLFVARDWKRCRRLRYDGAQLKPRLKSSTYNILQYPVLSQTESHITVPHITDVWRGTPELMSQSLYDDFITQHIRAHGSESSENDNDDDANGEAEDEDEDDNAEDPHSHTIPETIHEDSNTSVEEDEDEGFWRGIDTAIPRIRHPDQMTLEAAFRLARSPRTED